MSIVVTLVTYNRLNDLKTTLAAYEKQSMLPDEIIVVDNASTDGTCDFLNEWEKSKSPIKKNIICSPQNTGGAGGFNLALAAAVTTSYDYVYISDDDAVPEPDTLKLLIENSLLNQNNVTALCTAVMNHGEYDISHRSRVTRELIRIKDIEVGRNEYSKDFFEVDRMTFVGALVKRSAIEKVGLPLKEYFIYSDDSEYSFRLKKIGRIFCIPKSIMHHNVERSIGKKAWVDYYGYRNYLDMVRRHFPRRYWYYAITMLYIKKCSILAGAVWGKSKAYREMSKTMISDSIHCRFGKSEKYPLGCKIE